MSLATGETARLLLNLLVDAEERILIVFITITIKELYIDIRLIQQPRCATTSANNSHMRANKC